MEHGPDPAVAAARAQSGHGQDKPAGTQHAHGRRVYPARISEWLGEDRARHWNDMRKTMSAPGSMELPAPK